VIQEGVKRKKEFNGPRKKKDEAVAQKARRGVQHQRLFVTSSKQGAGAASKTMARTEKTAKTEPGGAEAESSPMSEGRRNAQPGTGQACRGK